MFIIFYLSSLKNVRPSQKFPLSLCCLSVAATTFFCPPIKCQWPPSCPRKPHLNWQHIQITSFRSVGLCFIKLGARWGSNRISLPFKLQLQTCCQWVRPSLHFPYFPNSLLDLILFDYNMAPTDRHYASALKWFLLHLTSLTHCAFVRRQVSHRLTH